MKHIKFLINLNLLLLPVKYDFISKQRNVYSVFISCKFVNHRIGAKNYLFLSLAIC